jgi:adenylate cyclase
MGVARDLASRIPNARLVVLEGTVAGWEVPDEAMAALAQHLGLSAPRVIADVRAPSPGIAIILFADIAGSTALTERLGDAAFREKARVLDEALRRAISANGGTAIEGKLLGDGVLATFGAAREAITCASALHALAGTGATGQGPSRDDVLLLHIGIHAGDVIRERAPDGRDNVFGGAVNIAARISGEAAAGETLVSQTVRDLARTSANVTFEDRDERELKGVSEPVRVFAVHPSTGSGAGG